MLSAARSNGRSSLKTKILAEATECSRGRDWRQIADDKRLRRKQRRFDSKHISEPLLGH